MQTHGNKRIAVYRNEKSSQCTRTSVETAYKRTESTRTQSDRQGVQADACNVKNAPRMMAFGFAAIVNNVDGPGLMG